MTDRERGEYWLPGYNLSRHIVLSQIQYFLGPDASVRPYNYQVRYNRLSVLYMLNFRA
jgi:hypothetical protein